MALTDMKHQKQREAMQRARFGRTTAEIMKEKGNQCVHCGKPLDIHTAVIDHIQGGGRHATENGMLPPETHDMNNLQVMCQQCAGLKDRTRGMMGMGIEGNANNPSQ